MSTMRKLKVSKPTDYQGYANLFLLYQEGRGLVAKTIKVQQNILSLLLAKVHCKFSDTSALKQVVEKMLAGKNEGYYNKMLTTYRQFFDFLIAEGEMIHNPVADFNYRREISQKKLLRRLGPKLN